MKLKFVTVAGILLFTVMFLAAGCNNASSSDSGSSSLSGTLYQLQGIVINSVTNQPISGVTVELDSGRSVQTDAAGAFLIKNVMPDDSHVYHLSVYKGGYAARQETVSALDAGKFKSDDLFNEIKAHNELLAAFATWVKKQEIPQDGASVTNNGWTYSGGGTFNNSGGGSVTYNEGTQSFDWNLPLKVDYAYSYGVGIPVIALAPLIGGLTGEINVVFAAQGADAHDKTAPIKNDVDVYVKTIGANSVSYGPVKTRNGAFSIEGLPAGATFNIYTNGFSQNDGNTPYFFEGVVYTTTDLSVGYVSAAAVGTSTTTTGSPGDKLVTRINDLYIFKAADIAFVATTNVGANTVAAAPLAVTGPITLTFTKDIIPGTFVAYLDGNNSGTYDAANDYSLIPSWSAANAVSLTVGKNAANSGHSYLHLPYSGSAGASVGNLVISGKAVDGSIIATNALPVYTEPGLSLVKVEVVKNQTGRTLNVIAGYTVNFTFSKAIENSPALGFYEYNGGAQNKKLSHKVDGAVAHVYIDYPFDAGTDRIGYRNINSAADSDDALTNNNTGSGSLVYIASQVQLSLRSTNLYNTTYTYATAGANPNGAAAWFPSANNITLTFNEPIPAGAAVYAQLQTGTTTLSPAVTAAGYTVTLSNFNPALAVNTTYNLDLKVILGGKEVDISKPRQVVDIAGNSIQFTTAP